MDQKFIKNPYNKNRNKRFIAFRNLSNSYIVMQMFKRNQKKLHVLNLLNSEK